MKTLTRGLIRTVLASALLLPVVLPTAGLAAGNENNVQHVLLISVDGMHEVDLRLWIEGHPNGALAALAKHGTTYSEAYTTAQAIVNGSCVVVYPHQFIRVNTIFEVMRAHGLHTAWSDKHPAYEILNGPSGKGIEDLYTPEINSQLPGAPAGQDNTTSFSGVRAYDATKVAVVINQIKSLSSVGTAVGYIPAIFGMNFQSVSVGQKLAVSGYGDPAGLVGGYADASGTPGNALTGQLAFVDNSIGQMVAALKSYHVYDNTMIIVSAKHGQSPINRSLRRAIPDTYSTVLANDGYGFNIADDASLIWLDPSKRTPATLTSTLTDLQAASTALGIQTILGRNDLTKYYRDLATYSRTPEFFVVSQKGVIYTTEPFRADGRGGLA